MNWSRSELNHIRVSLDRCNAQELADELGRAKESVEEKIREIKITEELSGLCQYTQSVDRTPL